MCLVPNSATAPRRPAPVQAPRVTDGLAHAKPGDLLDTYWKFVQSPYAGIAAMMVSTLGVEKSMPVCSGDLCELLTDAAALQKAHGRNIERSTVQHDLDVEIPSGFVPTFDLYLRAAGIKPDTNEDRAVARSVMSAIRRKIKEVRALNEQAAA